MEKTKNVITAKDVAISQDWKNKNKLYLKQLQKFLDLADNIKDEKLRKSIICQMLKCDDTLTKIIEGICKDICNKSNKI